MDAGTIPIAARSLNTAWALEALADGKSNFSTTRIASYHQDPVVVLAAVEHPCADLYTLHAAATNKDPAVLLAVLRHKKATMYTVNIVSLNPIFNMIQQIAAGSPHTIALRADGTVQAWGSNGSGQCDIT